MSLEKGREVASADFYQELRVKMREWLRTEEGKNSRWAEYLMLAPDLFHLLCKLMLEREVWIKDKAKVAAALAYFMSGIDFIPEVFLGPVGFVDDIALAAYVLNSIVSNTDAEVLRRHWAGEEDILEVVKRILQVADQMVGSGLWKRIKRRLG